MFFDGKPSISVATNVGRTEPMNSHIPTRVLKPVASFGSALSSGSAANSSGKNIKSSSSYMSPIENSPLIPNNSAYNFLIVDDNPINLKILSKTLSKIFPRANLVKLANSATVLELLARERFDLVFLDIEMPPVNGVEISKKIRSSKKFNQIGLIAVTTRFTEKDLTVYKRCGIDYTFRKPLNYSYNAMLNNIEIILNYRKTCQ